MHIYAIRINNVFFSNALHLGRVVGRDLSKTWLQDWSSSSEGIPDETDVSDYIKVLREEIYYIKCLVHTELWYTQNNEIEQL